MKPIIHYVCFECEERGKTKPPCKHFKESYEMHYQKKHHEIPTKTIPKRSSK